ncbi:DUF3726 domain-containing protein [uncultured Ruegeria sp.]|uniref:DUF3726 domain-containing protein n=1 Tax=uncultured Ruegeria sp. TaxID=259304 RepID=UPI002618A734|nr:DUF3726 domain-containing protein [uncultured Ruegeria sp.]
MTFSLNEVEATAKRATRGAGYAWGVAEEAAKTTRWLCAQGFDGPAILAQLLQREFASCLERHIPTVRNEKMTGEQDLCPLMTGTAISDSPTALSQGTVSISNVAAPLLLLPFVAAMAKKQKKTVEISFDGFSALTDGVHLSCGDCRIDRADHVEIAEGGHVQATRAVQSRAAPNVEAWQFLNTIAHRTYAPATEESRLLGAGSGLSDND